MSQHDDRLVRRVAEAAAGRDPDGPCPDAEVLGLYAERGLDSDEYGRVEAHLAGCARCQATVAAFVRSAPEAADVAGAAGQGVGGVQSWWPGWRWLAPVTATAVVVMLAVWVGRGPSEQAAESVRVEAGPAVSDRATVPPEPSAPAQPPGAVVAGSGADSPRALRKEADGPPAERAAAAEAPAVGALADRPQASAAAHPPAAPSALAAAEARFERAQPERQREVEARRDAATDQFRAAAGPPTSAAPAGQAPPVPAAVPAPAEETAAGNPAAAAAGGGRGVRAPAGNDAAAPGSMAKATASATNAATGSQRIVELTGRVTYRTRQALPPGATIDVRLLDVSRVDAPAQELGRTVVVTKGEQVPVPFAIRYDANAIDARRRYTVQATITVEGRVAFRTTTAQLVLTNGGSGTDVEVVVEPQR